MIAISLRDCMCFVILVVALSDFWKNPMGIKAGSRHSVCVHKRGFGSDCKSINRRQSPAVRCCDETFMQRCPWPVGALRQMNSIKISKWFFRVRSEACSQVLHKTGSYERVMKTKEVTMSCYIPWVPWQMPRGSIEKRRLPAGLAFSLALSPGLCLSHTVVHKHSGSGRHLLLVFKLTALRVCRGIHLVGKWAAVLYGAQQCDNLQSWARLHSTGHRGSNEIPGLQWKQGPKEDVNGSYHAYQ